MGRSGKVGGGGSGLQREGVELELRGGRPNGTLEIKEGARLQN